MRIACVYPNRDKWAKFAWIKDAIVRLGHDVKHIRGGHAAAAKELADVDAWADLVLFEQKWTGAALGDFIRLARNPHATWVSWNADLMALEPSRSLENQLTVHARSAGVKEPTPWLRQLRAMEVAFVKERSLLGEYHALNVRAAYLDQGCPSWMAACEHHESPEWDVLVLGKWGRSWQARRHAALVLATEGFQVAWAGHAGGDTLPRGILPLEWTQPDQLPALVSNAACVLCVDFRTDLDGYTSDRTWLVTGMGAVMVRPRDWLGEGPFLTFGSDEELIAQVTAIRKDVAKRRQIGSDAREWVMAYHTIESRCQQLLETVEHSRAIVG